MDHDKIFCVTRSWYNDDRKDELTGNRDDNNDATYIKMAENFTADHKASFAIIISNFILAELASGIRLIQLNTKGAMPFYGNY